MPEIGVRELHESLSATLGRVRYGRETFIIKSREQPIARLSPVEEPMQDLPEPGRAPAEKIEPDRAVTLFAPRIAMQVLEQCDADAHTARLVLLQALMMLEKREG